MALQASALAALRVRRSSAALVTGDRGGHNVDAILQLQANAGHMLLHLERSSSLSCNESNQTNMAHALDALKERLGNSAAINRNENMEDGSALRWSDIFSVRWEHLTPPEQNLLYRLSGFLRSQISPPPSSLQTSREYFDSLPYKLSAQDLLFVWLSTTDPLDTLKFKWKTVANLKWNDLTAEEQRFFERSEVLVPHLSDPIFRVPRLEAPYDVVERNSEIIWLSKSRPQKNFSSNSLSYLPYFTENFRNTSNAEGPLG